MAFDHVLFDVLVENAVDGVEDLRLGNPTAAVDNHVFQDAAFAPGKCESFTWYIQQGFVTSSVEIGSDEHAGTRRLSLRFGNRQWRAVVEIENEVQHEELTFLKGRSPKRSPRQ